LRFGRARCGSWQNNGSSPAGRSEATRTIDIEERLLKARRMNANETQKKKKKKAHARKTHPEPHIKALIIRDPRSLKTTTQ